MKKQKLIFSQIAISLALFIGCSSPNMDNTTQIFTNGTIVTMDEDQPSAEAIAIKDGKILAVGSLKEVNKASGKGCEVVDLKGKTLMPGFIDSHVHPYLSAVLYSWADVSGFSHPDKDDVWAALKEAIAKKQPGEWVFAFGWDPMLVPGLTAPHIKELDKLAPNNPVFILQQNMHTGYVNSKAFELLDITKETPDPGHGGFYDRDKEGNLPAN